MIELHRYNPHWKPNFFYQIPIERNFLSEIKKKLGTGLILGVFGLRRVGKTTALKQLIDHLIKNGVKRKNILFYSFDEPLDLMKVIEEYERMIGKEISSENYLLLDEINFSPNWKARVKFLYDRYKPKIIITGSQTALIKKESISLAGRILEIIVQPLSFKEYLMFTNNLHIYDLKDVEDEFHKYLSRQFPETINMDLETVQEYVKSIYKKIIYEDIPKIFNIDEPYLLERLFLIIANHPGILISITDLSKELGVNRNKISEYLKYLEDAFLIKKLYNFSNNRLTSEKKLKKFYVWPSFANASFDLLVESYICMFNQIKFFWRDKQKNEVDAILKNLAIEVKYRNVVTKKEIKGLLKFLKKFREFKGSVIIKQNSKIEKIKGIEFLLPWEFEKEFMQKI